MSDDDGGFGQMQRLHPIHEMLEHPIHLIRAQIRFWTVAMSQQVERVGGVTVLREVGDQLIPIMQGRGDTVDHDDRCARALLNETRGMGNDKFIFQCGAHNVWLILFLKLFR